MRLQISDWLYPFFPYFDPFSLFVDLNRSEKKASTIIADEDPLVNQTGFLACPPKKRSGKNVGAGRG